MKKDGKYRFTLQFGADSEDQIRVGELLEKLGMIDQGDGPNDWDAY